LPALLLGEMKTEIQILTILEIEDLLAQKGRIIPAQRPFHRS